MEKTFKFTCLLMIDKEREQNQSAQEPKLLRQQNYAHAHS